MIKISNRLMTAASLVTEGNVLADVGTDHGYIPIYLLEQKKIKSAIAMDINRGPLERAKEHIAAYGMDAYIQTRLSDGVEALQIGEADTILAAGMGGGIVIHIMRDGAQVCKAAKELILQPQSELERVRIFLREEGYTVLAEEMVFEDEKFYPMMKVRYDGKHFQNADAQWQKLEGLYGGFMLRNRHPVLKTYLEKEKRLYDGIKVNLLSRPQSEKIQKRLAEVEEVLKYNGLALQCYKN